MKLWGGRFEKQTSGLVDDFHSSITFDQRLAHLDITGSIAHATMLGAQGIIPKEDADKIAARSAREKELAEKHAKTEKLKAEGKTEVNTNTSKKKLQQQNKQSNEERRKAAERAEREERRARLGIEIEKNDSQVGDRRFARGRAYEADRFKNRKQDAENNTNVNED